jgi:hypothetical protein
LLKCGDTRSCGCAAPNIKKGADNPNYNGNAARRRGTLAYFKSNTWGNLQQRTVNGSSPNPHNKSYLDKNIKLEMTKNDFYCWCDGQVDNIMLLYRQNKTPSIDRIDNNGNYSLDNIQILGLQDNVSKDFDLKVVELATISKRKPIEVGMPCGTVYRFISIKHACLYLRLSESKVSSLLHFKIKGYRGIKVRYINKNEHTSCDEFGRIV